MTHTARKNQFTTARPMVPMRLARALDKDRMMRRFFCASPEQMIQITNSPMGDSLEGIRPDDWAFYKKAREVRELIKAGRDFTDALAEIDPDNDLDADALQKLKVA